MSNTLVGQDATIWRRFGRNHDKPCKRPEILTCAMWECQKADKCRWNHRREKLPMPHDDAMNGDFRTLPERLRHAAATAQNDDYTEPMSEMRARHVARVMVMAEAADEIERLRIAMKPAS
jgi:hypothetical protein